MRKMRSLVQSAVIVLATGAAGAVAFNAWADKTDKVTDKRPPACDQHRPGRPGPDAEGPGAPGGPGAMPFGGRMLERMLDDVKATPEQRKQIKDITDAAAADMKALHEANGKEDLHAKSMDALLAPQVDVPTIEKLHEQMNAEHEKAGKRMLQAMVDVAKVLTPEQRAKVAEQMKKHREDRPHEPGARFRGEK